MNKHDVVLYVFFNTFLDSHLHTISVSETLNTVQNERQAILSIQVFSPLLRNTRLFGRTMQFPLDKFCVHSHEHPIGRRSCNTRTRCPFLVNI